MISESVGKVLAVQACGPELRFLTAVQPMGRALCSYIHSVGHTDGQDHGGRLGARDKLV